MTISAQLDAIHREAVVTGVDLKNAGILDDEDLQLFALNYLLANLEDAFDWSVKE